MVNLFQKLAGVENVAAVIETRLGLPQRRHLLFRHQFLNTARTASTIEDFLVIPCPYITSAPPRLIGLLVGNEEQAVSVSSTDIYVELARTVPYDRFVRADGKRAIAFVDVQTNSSGTAPLYSNDVTKTLTAGMPCRIIHINDSDDTLWKLILRRDKD
ncbi:hypothetical protein IQ273_12860 [Nodosilinea sp. LEGE 07298]|uniref:hypothetical protein n=1 Tax=Nodosilinea sp. LEGE 07298 TaxID=2777970 RepID=UPI00187F9B6F|nr:hypothetical protein [Nodosilinea sp. LEGE 07298]MBE9110303.1 hypothetical protein [Nodosilinea sp. LEGE 07298]